MQETAVDWDLETTTISQNSVAESFHVARHRGISSNRIYCRRIYSNKRRCSDIVEVKRC